MQCAVVQVECCRGGAHRMYSCSGAVIRCSGTEMVVQRRCSAGAEVQSAEVVQRCMCRCTEV